MTNMKNPSLQKHQACCPVAASIGTIIGVRGPIIDARFDDQTPDIFDALLATDAKAKAVKGA